MAAITSQVFRFALGLFGVPLEDKYIEAKRHRHGPVETYEIFVEDFRRIRTEAEAIGSDLTFGSIWISIAVTSTAALPTIPHDWNRIFSSFLTAMLVGYSLGFYFLSRWRRQKSSLVSLMDRIQASQIPQWGSEGNELRVSEIDKLKPEEPPSPQVAAEPMIQPPEEPAHKSELA